MPEILIIVRKGDLQEEFKDHPEKAEAVETTILDEMGKLMGITDVHDLAFDWIAPFRSKASAGLAVYLPYSIRPKGLAPLEAAWYDFTKAASTQLHAALKGILPDEIIGVWFMPIPGAGYTEA